MRKYTWLFSFVSAIVMAGALRGELPVGGFPGEIAIPSNAPGFCLDLGCGDGKLAAEIAQKTKYVVFAIAKDDGDCESARQALAQAGLYGTRATAVTGSLKKLPLPDYYGNLIVTGDYQEELDLKEVFRVLNPNGMAVIGGGKTDAAKLKAALEAAGIKGYSLAGNYAVFHGRMPEGTHEWTHWSPRADNIRTSYETKVRPPFRTQWLLAEPSFDDSPCQHAAVAGGRIFFRNAIPKPELDRIYAFDSFNGAVLWDRRVPVGGKNNCRYAAVDNVLYWIGSRGMIDAYDPETGKLLKSYPIPGADYAWWVAVENGVLYAFGKSTNCVSLGGTYGVGNIFCARDVKSGDLLWKYECKLPVLLQSAALDGKGGLYFYGAQPPEAADAGKGKDKAKSLKGMAYALEAKTGNERWHTDLGLVSATYIHMGAAGCIDDKYFVWGCVDGKGGGTKALDAKTGQIVKEYPGVHSWGEGNVAPVLFVDGKMYCQPRAGRDPYLCYDMATGEKLKTKIDQFRGRDNPGTASMNCFYVGGEGFCVQDFVAGKQWDDPYIRYSDYAGPFVAEGMLFHMPSVCHCPHAMGGPVALAPAGADWAPPEATNDMRARLVIGTAFETPLAEDGKEDWTHYRANAGHTGESATAPKSPLAIDWERKLGSRLTPPSFGAGLVYTASRDGRVWALDQATGEIRWKFLCGACVRVTPAYAKGRVLFSSHDGWVYCLEARTGRLAWRFRAAPEERYINTEGQMNSLWPSAAGVVVDGDVAYCAAGLQAYDGTYLYALNLKTGVAAWAKRIGDPDGKWGSPQGIMALAGDTLVVPVYAGQMNRGYRKANGEELTWYKEGRRFWTFGSEAIADGDVWFYGGHRHGEGTNPTARPQAFTAMSMEDGWVYGPKSGEKHKSIAPACVAPVLGRQVILGDGVMYDRAKFLETARKDPAQTDSAKLWAMAFWRPAGDTKKPRTTGLALAGGVVLASGESEVVLFEGKADGKELCRVAVPGTILRNSLATTAGKVFVVTEDGSVCCLAP